MNNDLSDLTAIVRAQMALPHARVVRTVDDVRTCTADKIIAASRRARGEEFVADVPQALEQWTCTADDIMRAAAKARGEVKEKQPPLTGVAQQIIAAGKRARNAS